VQAEKNKARVLRRVQQRQRQQQNSAIIGDMLKDALSREERLDELRKCVAKVDVPDISKATLEAITKVLFFL